MFSYGPLITCKFSSSIFLFRTLIFTIRVFRNPSTYAVITFRKKRNKASLGQVGINYARDQLYKCMPGVQFNKSGIQHTGNLHVHTATWWCRHLCHRPTIFFSPALAHCVLFKNVAISNFYVSKITLVWNFVILNLLQSRSICIEHCFK